MYFGSINKEYFLIEKHIFDYFSYLFDMWSCVFLESIFLIFIYKIDI